MNYKQDKKARDFNFYILDVFLPGKYSGNQLATFTEVIKFRVSNGVDNKKINVCVYGKIESMASGKWIES